MAEFELPGDAASPLGKSAAAVLAYLSGVIDREDRLEIGTGTWLAGLRDDPAARAQAVRDSVLRALGIAADSVNFTILEQLVTGPGRATADLVAATGLGRLPLAERVGDLVSAGLAAKVPEADQVTATAAGAAVVRLVHAAVAAGAGELEVPG